MIEPRARREMEHYHRMALDLAERCEQLAEVFPWPSTASKVRQAASSLRWQVNWERIEHLTCDVCCRGDYPIVLVEDDANVCQECVAFHERAIDEAIAVTLGMGYPMTFGERREMIEAAVKAYLEYSDEPSPAASAREGGA